MENIESVLLRFADCIVWIELADLANYDWRGSMARW